jgi:hypothetical protein
MVHSAGIRRSPCTDKCSVFVVYRLIFVN